MAKTTASPTNETDVSNFQASNSTVRVQDVEEIGKLYNGHKNRVDSDDLSKFHVVNLFNLVKYIARVAAASRCVTFIGYVMQYMSRVILARDILIILEGHLETTDAPVSPTQKGENVTTGTSSTTTAGRPTTEETTTTGASAPAIFLGLVLCIFL